MAAFGFAALFALRFGWAAAAFAAFVNGWAAAKLAKALALALALRDALPGVAFRGAARLLWPLLLAAVSDQLLMGSIGESVEVWFVLCIDINFQIGVLSF